MMAKGIVPLKATEHVRDTCLCLHTQRAARALARRFDEALRPVRLTNEQFSLLMALNRPEPTSVGDAAFVLGVDHTTLTAALKPIVREGLARITIDAKDRRVRRVALTKSGQRRLASAWRIWKRAHRDVERALKDVDAPSMRRGLNRLAMRNS